VFLDRGLGADAAALVEHFQNALLRAPDLIFHDLFCQFGISFS
jgi:hypothetical protein